MKIKAIAAATSAAAAIMSGGALSAAAVSSTSPVYSYGWVVDGVSYHTEPADTNQKSCYFGIPNVNAANENVPGGMATFHVYAAGFSIVNPTGSDSFYLAGIKKLLAVGQTFSYTDAPDVVVTPDAGKSPLDMLAERASAATGSTITSAETWGFNFTDDLGNRLEEVSNDCVLMPNYSLSEADWVNSDYQPGKGFYPGSGGKVTTVSPTTTTTVTPGSPAVTKVVHHPAVTTTTTKHNSVLVQVDKYLPIRAAKTSYVSGVTASGKYRYAYNAKARQMTPAEKARVAALDDHNTLGYRADGFTWGASLSKIVSVSDVDVTRYGSFAKAIAAKSGLGAPSPNIVSMGNAPVTKAWVLGAGATAAQPWGASHTISQTDFDATKAPSAVVNTVVVKKAYDTVEVVKPAVAPTTTTHYWCGATEVDSSVTSCPVG